MFLFALVNGSMAALSVAAANPPILPPAVPARDTNPWAKNPGGTVTTAQSGK